MRRTAAPIVVVVALVACATVAAPAAMAPSAPEQWRRAADALPEPVFQPVQPAGLRLSRFTVRGRGTSNPLVDAVYERPDGAYLRLIEGGPRCCGEGGDAPMIGRVALFGGKGRLYDYGEGPFAAEGGLTLYFTREGTEVALVTSRIARDDLLAIARGMRRVWPPHPR